MKSFITGTSAPGYANETPVAFTTILPLVSPEEMVNELVPTAARRAANSSRSFRSAATRPSLRVVRAFTPLRIHASS